MMLLEHDAKNLLKHEKIPVPNGYLVTGAGAGAEMLGSNVVVKVQVPCGGRGKAGGIRKASGSTEAITIANEFLGSEIKSFPVRSVRVEDVVSGHEGYVSLAIDAGAGEVVIMMSESGGIEVEELAEGGVMLSARSRFDREAVKRGAEDLAAQLGDTYRKPLLDALTRLADVFFNHELMLVEVNPLFLTRDGDWISGDAKIVTDLNALPRQEFLQKLLRERGEDYPAALMKLESGFDYVVLDENGTIGLITTGAGLSMQVCDELEGMGASPINFCDMRAGGLNGDPTRLVQILQRLAGAPNLKVALVNIFAGITHLGEFTETLLLALDQVPEFDVPVVLRLVGRGQEDAAALIDNSSRQFLVEPDLDAAIARCVDIAREEVAR